MRKSFGSFSTGAAGPGSWAAAAVSAPLLVGAPQVFVFGDGLELPMPALVGVLGAALWVFVLVNAGLALLSAFTGRHFALVSAFIWGLGLLIHGAAVFMVPPGSSFRERLVQQERERLQRQQDKS